MIRMPRFGVVLLACLLPLALVGCDAVGGQAEFEDAAFSTPLGITRTNTDGSIVENDPDDWRISPLYSFSVFGLSPLTPNPVSLSEQFASLQIRIDGSNAVPGGLQLVANPGTPQRRTVATDPNAISSGIYILTFSPSVIPGIQPGDLVRLILYDGQGNIVSYGDMLIGS